jgi:hypothetical protein
LTFFQIYIVLTDCLLVLLKIFNCAFHKLNFISRKPSEEIVITVQNFVKLVGFKIQILSRVHAFVFLRSGGCYEVMSFSELWQALYNEGKTSFAVKDSRISGCYKLLYLSDVFAKIIENNISVEDLDQRVD